jgi:hypothetical protein
MADRHRRDRSIVAALDHGVCSRIFGSQVPQPRRLVVLVLVACVIHLPSVTEIASARPYLVAQSVVDPAVQPALLPQ